MDRGSKGGSGGCGWYERGKVWGEKVGRGRGEVEAGE